MTTKITKSLGISNEDLVLLDFIELLQDSSDDGIHHLAMIIGPFVYHHVLLVSGRVGLHPSKDEIKNMNEKENWVYKHIERVIMKFVFKDTKHSLLLNFSKKFIDKLESGFYDYLDSWLFSKSDFVEKSVYLKERLGSLNTLLYEPMDNDKYILSGMNKNNYTMQSLLDHIENIISDVQSNESQLDGKIQNDMELIQVSHHDPIIHWIAKLKKSDIEWNDIGMELDDDIQWLDIITKVSKGKTATNDTTNREHRWNEVKYVNVLKYLVSQSERDENRKRYIQKKMTKFAFIQKLLVQFIVDDMLDGFNEYMDIYIVTHEEFKSMKFSKDVNDDHVNVIFKIIREFMWFRDPKHFQFVTNWIKREDDKTSNGRSNEKIRKDNDGDTFATSYSSMVYRYDLYVSFMKHCMSMIEWFNLFPYYHFSNVPSDKSDVFNVDYSCVSAFEKMYDAMRDDVGTSVLFGNYRATNMSPMGRIIYESSDKSLPRDSTKTLMSSSTINMDKLPLSQRRSTMLMLFGYIHDILISKRYDEVRMTSDRKVLNSMYWMGHMENRQLKLIRATPSLKVFIKFVRLTLLH